MANSDATPLLFNPMVFCKFELLPVKMASKDKSGIASKKIVSECVDSFSLVDDSLSTASLDTISAPAKLHRCFLEILWHVVGELFTPKVAVSILEFACSSKKEGIMTLLVDVLWLVACQCRAALGNSSDGMTRLSCLINLLASQGIISKDLAQERLDLYILESSNLIPSRNAIHKKLVKSNTKQLYTQSKFNLLREETEGYSKLITALNQDINYKTLPAVKKNIRGLIGQFFLDPNRVFDLVLESYENNLSNPCYNSLVSLFKEDNIVHVLGFKFQCFANAFQQVPVSLCRLSALLLAQSKLGVNGVDQLWPHLSPSDAELITASKECREDMAAKLKKIGVVSLTGKSDSQREKFVDKPYLIEPFIAMSDEDREEAGQNSKFRLLVGALDMRCWSLAVKLLRRFESLGIDATDDKDVLLALIRLVNYLIEPIYNSEISCVNVRFRAQSEIPSIKSRDSHQITTSRMIIDDESESFSSNFIKAPERFDNLASTLLPVLSEIGPLVARDIKLYTKLCRLMQLVYGKYDCSTPPHCDVLSDPEESKCMRKIVSDILLPGLSLVGPNPAVVSELWLFFSQFSCSERYDMYGKWHAGLHILGSHPLMHRIRKKTEYATKTVLKRLALETVRLVGRQIGKLSHSNPLHVFQTIIMRIEAFDNLIQPVVDSLRYVTPMAADCLVCVLVSKLGGGSRSRIKADGANISHWLNSLAKFTGSFFKKYHTTEMSGLLQFITTKLKANESVDLCILQQLLARVAGLETFDQISDQQLEGLAGGSELKQQTSILAISSTHISSRATSSLKKALVDGEKPFALPLLVMISQQLDATVFSQSSVAGTHLKMIGGNFDDVQVTLRMYCEFLNQHLSPEEIVSRLPLPSLSSLILDYNVSPAAAFNMCRSSLRRALQVKDDKSSNACLIPWQPFANPMINAIRTIFADQWNSLSPELYMTFWTYELYDIYVPETLYQSRIKSIKDRIAALANKPVSTFGKLSSEVKAEEKLRRKTNDNLSSSLSKLKRELAAQQACSRVVLQSMNLTKSNWLCNISEEKDSESISEQIVRRLLFPRLKYSPAGASYSAKFILLLHNLNTPSFSTTKCLEICFNALPATVLCLSECEAGNLGIFLKEIFQLIKSWRSSTKLFGLGAQSKVGFLVEPSNSKNKTKLTYVQFKKLSQKWYDRVAQVMMQCLDSSDYMQIRNGLIVLLKISEIFPWCYKTSALLEKYTAKLVDAEEREDLRIMASRYHATLSKLLKGFKPAVGDVVAKSNSKKGRSTRKNSSSERAVSGNAAMQSSSRLKDREDGKRRDGDDRRRDGPKRDDRRDDRRDGPRRDGPRRDDRRDGPRRDGPKRDDRRDGPKRNRDDPRGSYRKDMNNVGRATLDREKNIRGDKDRRDRSRSRERPNTNNFKRDRGRDRDKDSNPKVGSKRSRETVVNANKSKGISFSSNRPVKRHRSMNNGNTSNMNSSKRDRGNNSPVPPSSNSRSQKQNSNRTSLNTESALRLKLEKAKQDKLKTRPKSPRRSPRANGRENKKDAEKHRESSKKSSRDNRDGGRQNSRRQSGGRKSLGVNGDGNRNGKKKVSPNNRGNRNNRNRR